MSAPTQIATEISIYRTTGDGVTKSGDSYAPNGLSESGIDRRPGKRIQTRNPARVVDRNIPINWETEFSLQLEFDHSTMWDAILACVAPEADAAQADTPSSGLTTTKRYVRKDDDALLWGATVTLEDGQCYRLDGMTIRRIMIKVGGRRATSATVRFGVLNMTAIDSGSKDIPDVTHNHKILTKGEVNPYLKIGNQVAWSSPRSNDAATIISAAWDINREGLQPAAFDSNGIPQRWEFGGGFQFTGRATLTIAEATAKLLQTGAIDARLGFGFDTPKSDESIFWDFPSIRANARKLEPTGRGWALTEIDWMGIEGAGGEIAQISMVS